MIKFIIVKIRKKLVHFLENLLADSLLRGLVIFAPFYWVFQPMFQVELPLAKFNGANVF